MSNIEIGVIVALIVGINKVIGKYLNSRYLPITAILLGIVLSVIVGGITSTAILMGLVAGLSSMGLYDTAKRTVLGK